MSNKNTIESQFEAVAGISAEKAGERDAPEGKYVFRTEWERQNFLSRMTKQDVLDAQAWIKEQRAKYPGTLESLFADYDRAVAKYAAEKWGVESETRTNLAGAKADRVVSDAGSAAVAALAGAEKAAKDAKRSAEKSGSFAENFDRTHAEKFRARLSAAAEAIDKLAAAEGLDAETKAKLEALSKFLREFAKNPTPANALAAQNAALALDANARFTQRKNDGKPDSLFGPITMAVVEKIAKIRSEVSDAPAAVNPNSPAGGTPSGSGSDVPPAPVKPGRPSAPAKPGRQPGAGSSPDAPKPSAPEAKENVPYANVLSAYESFMKLAKETDVFMAGARKSDAEIAKDRERLNASLAHLLQTMRAYEASGNRKDAIDWMKLNLSYYYSDDLSGVSAGLKKDLVLSQNLAIDLMDGKIDRLPSSEDEIMQTLESLKGTKIGELIGKRIEERMAAGEPVDLFQILSNPMVKGGWERAYEKVLEKNLAKLDRSIDEWTRKRSMLSETERKALDHLVDLRGKGGAFDFKATNRDQMWQMLKYGAAIGAGIAGSALVASGVGAMPGALLLSAAAGGAITTGGTMLARGSRYSLGEGAGEFAINTATFGLGGLLFRVANGARAVEFAAKAGTAGKVALYSVEGVGNVGIGVSADFLRANLQGEDLDLWNSVQQNLIWAALPFALRARGVKVPPEIAKDVQALNAEAQNIGYLQRLGRPVTGPLKKLAERAREVADKVKAKFPAKEIRPADAVPEARPMTSAEARNAIASDVVALRKEVADARSRIRWNRDLLKNPELNPVTRKKLENEIFTLENRVASLRKQIDGNVAYAPKKESTAPETAPARETSPSAVETPVAPVTPVPEVAANVSDARFLAVSKEFGSRLRKAGDTFEADGFSVARTTSGYELKTGNSVTRYDTLDDLAAGLSAQVKTPAARLEFLSKFANEKLQKRLVSLDRTEVGEGYRIVHENGKIAYQKKVGNGWEPVKAEAVPENVQANAAEAVFGSKALENLSGTMRAVAKNPESLASSQEKKSFVAMFGENAWISAIRKFEAKLAGLDAVRDSHGHAHGWRTHGIQKWILGERGSGFLKSLGWAGAGQLFVPSFNAFNTMSLEPFRELGRKDAEELLLYTLLFRYVSTGRALVYSITPLLADRVTTTK